MNKCRNSYDQDDIKEIITSQLAQGREKNHKFCRAKEQQMLRTDDFNHARELYLWIVLHSEEYVVSHSELQEGKARFVLYTTKLKL